MPEPVKLRLYIVLMMACLAGNYSVAQLTDTIGAGLSKDEQLIMVADAGDTIRAGRLIRLGADVDAVTPEGVTSLMYATQNGNLSMMSLLIRSGANPDKKPSNGFTALITAIHNQRADLVEFLIRNGAGVDIGDNSKMTPLMHAIEVDSFYLADLLLYYDARIDLRRRDSADALMLAAWHGRYEIAVQLVESGADINNTDRSGLTPLHYAASAGNIDILKLLIGEGASLEARTVSGMTPLSVAVAKNNFAVSRLLIGSGANVNNRISATLNPLDLAEINNQDSIYMMLRNNGARKILWPWFNQVSIGGKFAFNRDDMLAGVFVGLSDRKYDLWVSLSYELRPKYIRVVIPDKGDNYFQYWEHRHLVSFTLDKAFLFPKKSSRVKGGFVAGFQESMTFGNYRGSYRGPVTGLILSPRVGGVFQYNRLRFRLDYQFLDLSLHDMSKSWFSFSAGVMFERKHRLKQNSITGL